MAQNITFMGASYSDVPAVNLPKTGGGQALFTDVTDTTATANDVAQGKYFYDASGVKTEGTSSGGRVLIADWDFSQSLIDSVNGNTVTVNSGVTQTTDGYKITGVQGAIKLPPLEANSLSYEIDVGNVDSYSGSGHARFFMWSEQQGLIFRNGTHWSVYFTSWNEDMSLTDYQYFANSTVKIVASGNKRKIYKEGVLVLAPTADTVFGNVVQFGSGQGASCVGVEIKGVRIYAEGA